MHFTQQVLLPELQSRRLLAQAVTQMHTQALQGVNTSDKSGWRIELGEDLLFDAAGLQLIKDALVHYRGTAAELVFDLMLEPATARDFYSHQIPEGESRLRLPVVAMRDGHAGETATEVISLALPCITTDIDYPVSLAESDVNMTPLALLLPYTCDHDLLFANQIAIFAELAHRIRHKPSAWLKGLVSRLPGKLKQRISLAYNDIHPGAHVHPTAVVEGAVIGPGCRIGAHCVVRYSVLGRQVRLHDGAKVEYSVIDDHSWLMHDLVLYRSLVEQQVFLIHGPYQFSYFQHASAAFATIMMDYRPDARPIRISTRAGIRDYRGRFLGALLEEDAKVLGGCITAPGITVPAGQQVTVDPAQITRAKTLLAQINELAVAG